MLASQLCLAAGILDVEAWLVTDDAKRILDWWEAFDRINPLPNAWMQTAIVCHELSRTQATVLASQGAKVGDNHVRDWQSYMPPRWRPPPKQKPIEQSDREREVVSKWAIG